MEKHYINNLKATGRPIKYEKMSPESTDFSNIEKICQGFLFVCLLVLVANGSSINPRKILQLSRQ